MDLEKKTLLFAKSISSHNSEFLTRQGTSWHSHPLLRKYWSPWSTAADEFFATDHDIGGGDRFSIKFTH